MEQEQEQDRRPSATGWDGNAATELAFLRRRLAFYEGFDELIQQNISRSGDLLRRASEQQAEAERAIAASRADLSRVAAAQRDALGSLAEELARVRSGLDGLAAQLESAQAALHRFAEPGAKPGFEPVSEPVRDPGAQFVPGSPGPAVAHPASDDSVVPNGASGYADQSVVSPVTESRVVREESGSIIVHGINGVDAARAYQSWLASRPGVRSVTPREFGGGVLRLDVSGVAFPGVDAAGWPGGPLDVVETGPGTTVLRVRGAAGL